MSAWCQERINAIGFNDAAKRTLITKWPEGLPTPKKGITTDEQVITLLNLLDAIETEFSLPWVPDPRTKFQKGSRETMNRTTSFMLAEMQ